MIHQPQGPWAAVKWFWVAAVVALAGCVESGIADSVMQEGDVPGYTYIPAETDWLAVLTGGADNPGPMTNPALAELGVTDSFASALGKNGSTDLAIVSLALEVKAESRDFWLEDGCDVGTLVMVDGNTILVVMDFGAGPEDMLAAAEAIEDRTGALPACEPIHAWF